MCIRDRSTQSTWVNIEFLFQFSQPAMIPRLIIVDPINYMNNVGRSTYNIQYIRDLFAISYSILNQSFTCGNVLCQLQTTSTIQTSSNDKFIGNKPCFLLRKMFAVSQNLVRYKKQVNNKQIK
eukprot:TRINITY_DN36049_c0_g1_i1.p2 TRINITY_DN36049_c0_g1~~TRINITY_DN36049_c0_g1_i1.p2  ORF type:complete len:123 (+),score=12.99 TRINITY_DN36049_c0_g1_i1:141-509(+)